MRRKKPEMQDIINNIKFMKIIRDIKFIKIESIFYKTDKLHKSQIYKNKKYYNLLKLIRNKFLYESCQNNNCFKKLTVNTLKNIDMNFYENICKYNNIEVVDLPVFETIEIINGIINIKSNSIYDYNISTNLDAITFIKNNQTKLIYLYLITDNRLRCKCVDDKNYLSSNRKEKLKNIKEKEDI